MFYKTGFMSHTQTPPIEVTDLLFSVCVRHCLSSFLCSWVWSSSWSWLQGSLPSSLRTGSKTSSTSSSTIMSRLTAMISTCRISLTLPKNMWVHVYWLKPACHWLLKKIIKEQSSLSEHSLFSWKENDSSTASVKKITQLRWWNEYLIIWMKQFR